MDYNNRKFRNLSNSSEGEVNTDTIFEYFQAGDTLTGIYHGGQIRQGQLLGFVSPDGRLHFMYHHMNSSGELKAGKCVSTSEMTPTGKLRLHEKWEWLTGAMESGESILEEID
ncbi:MAG: n-acetylglutamate synthase [Bacteroidia bacterium]|nr:n-acetylglutamate synthase [Bacteroidia bacterium]